MPQARINKGLKRSYTDDDKAAFYNSLETTCEGNVARAARLHDIPTQTARDWVKRGIPMSGIGKKTQLPA